MANIESIFDNPEKAMAIILHMTNSHEVAAQTITDVNKGILVAMQYANQTEKYMEKLNFLQVPQSMLENIQNILDIRESFGQTLSEFKAERADYDNYIMEVYSSILELCTIGQQIAASMANTDEYDIDDLIPNRESFFKEVYDLFHELATQTKDQVKEYANL